MNKQLSVSRPKVSSHSIGTRQLADTGAVATARLLIGFSSRRSHSLVDCTSSSQQLTVNGSSPALTHTHTHKQQFYSKDFLRFHSGRDTVCDIDNNFLSPARIFLLEKIKSPALLLATSLSSQARECGTKKSGHSLVSLYF